MWKRLIRLIGESLKSGDGTLRLVVVMGTGVLAAITLGFAGLGVAVAAKLAGLL
ncbi:hypothetical protein [Streptomyces sp. BK239]|uniref:hypothetical protein n=1 Tax=Streptomyces sp. BK239 TaxID=2512155 RepID=UPI0010EC3312|nr:hypothetical protein [Streptomyces sp. BK239]RZU21726.1 hypothetical protein EV567_2231 [Streptomyces sp. BK239]